MILGLSKTEHKSVERQAFEIYLRTGRRVLPSALRALAEQKFNPNHDPGDGRFTFSLGGPAPVTSPGSAQRSNPGDMSSPAASPKKKPITPIPRTASAPNHPLLPPGWKQGGKLTTSAIEAHAANAMAQYYENRARGMSVEDAAGWAANSEGESRGNHKATQIGGGPGRGLYQWGSPIPRFDRRIAFRRIVGVPIEESTREQQLQFRDWELANSHRGARRRIDAAIGAADKARAITIYYLAPKDKLRDAADRGNIAEAIVRLTRPKKK